MNADGDKVFRIMFEAKCRKIAVKLMVAMALVSNALIAGSVPEMKVDQRLSAMEPLQVDGRQGWLVRQVLEFGEYRTGPVKRSWTKGYDYPFIIRFTSAREKLQFDSVDGSGRRVSWFCAGKLSEQDFHKFRDYFDINLRTRDVFTCAVAVSGQQRYDLVVQDLNQNRTSGEVEGALRGEGLDIAIRPVWHLASGKKTWDTRPLGFEFTQGETVVAAVESVNEGRVWLDDTIDPEVRLVLAGLASALLLRSDLAEHND